MRPQCSAAAGAVPLPEGVAEGVAAAVNKVEDPMKSHKIVEAPFKGIGEDIKRKVGPDTARGSVFTWCTCCM